MKTGSNNARWVRNPVFCSAGIPPISDLPWLLPCGKSRSSVSSKYKPIKQGENSLRLLEKWHHILVALASSVVIDLWYLTNASACSHLGEIIPWIQILHMLHMSRSIVLIDEAGIILSRKNQFNIISTSSSSPSFQNLPIHYPGSTSHFSELPPAAPPRGQYLHPADR